MDCPNATAQQCCSAAERVVWLLSAGLQQTNSHSVQTGRRLTTVFRGHQEFTGL